MASYMMKQPRLPDGAAARRRSGYSPTITPTPVRPAAVIFSLAGAAESPDRKAGRVIYSPS